MSFKPVIFQRQDIAGSVRRGKKAQASSSGFLLKRDKGNVSLWICEHCCYFVNLLSGFTHRFVVHKAVGFTNYRVRALTESWITEFNRSYSNTWTSRCSGSRTAEQGSKDPSCYKQVVGLHLLFSSCRWMLRNCRSGNMLCPLCWRTMLSGGALGDFTQIGLAFYLCKQAVF